MCLENAPPFAVRPPFMYTHLIGLMQVSVQFLEISVTTVEVLYVVYIIITSVHQKV